MTSWHLRQLAAHGLVRDASDAQARRDHGRERWWEAVSRGFRFAGEPEDDARRGGPGARAGHGERGRGHRRPLARRRRARLEPQWRRLAGRANTRIVVTPAELDEVEAAIERLLAPYVLRKDDPADTHPAEARWVRVLRYTLPAADPEAPGGPAS